MAYLWTTLNAIFKNTHVLGAYKKRLSETFLLCTQNMFDREKSFLEEWGMGIYSYVYIPLIRSFDS